MTFNPQVEESLLEVSNTPPKPASLKEVADVVVRCLDPFYKQGKFSTKVRRRGLLLGLFTWTLHGPWPSPLTPNTPPTHLLALKNST